jgi:hypothetical protein
MKSRSCIVGPGQQHATALHQRGNANDSVTHSISRCARLVWIVTVCLLPLFGCTSVLVRFTGPEVAVVGPSRAAGTAPGDPSDGVLIDVKNVARRDDGIYVIELPEDLLRHLSEPGEGPNSCGSPSGSLAVIFDSEESFLVSGMGRLFRDSLNGLTLEGEPGETFDLRADVKRGLENELSVDIWIDIDQTGSWIKLGSAAIGQGTQRNGLRQTAWVLAPVAVAADVVFVAAGLVAGAASFVVLAIPSLLVNLFGLDDPAPVVGLEVPDPVPVTD